MTFKILDERQHLLKRPQMYIGAITETKVEGIYGGSFGHLTVVPGLVKIINEIIDNSVDEFIRTEGKYANKIRVSIRDGVVTVSDNGRGIPVKKAENGMYIPTAAWSMPRAGSNFGEDEDRTTMGMNGVGSFCTNVFSKSFSGITCDGKKVLTYKSSQNAENKDAETVKNSNGTPKGTTVEFTPDIEKFGIAEIGHDHINYILSRLTNLSVCFKGITFWLNGKKIEYTTASDHAKQFGQHVAFAENKSGILVLAPSGKDQEFRHLSYVNGLEIRNGGSHIDYIMASLCDTLRPAIKRKFKIEILPNQIKQHLLLSVHASGMKNMMFDSQSKERITNTKSFIANCGIFDFDFAKLAKKIVDTDELIQPIIEAVMAKKIAAERAALLKAQKAAKRKRIPSHISASSKVIADKVLFITEGDSAIGPLVAVRDPKLHGGYPLRGKILNTREMKPVDIVANKELSELMGILGLTLGDESIKNLNYGTIAIMADADHDGNAICGLLMNFFSNWPALFAAGIIHRVETPKYIVQKGSRTRFFYNDKDFDSANVPKSATVKYIKGLGSLDPDAYHDIINNPVLTQMAELCIMGEEKLEMAFGSNSAPRKKWLM